LNTSFESSASEGGFKSSQSILIGIWFK